MSSSLSVGRVPAYRRHKPSGQAVVTLCGKDHYLGRWNTKASRNEYDRLIGEWLASGRIIPQPDRCDDLDVNEVLSAFWGHAKGYYRKNGQPTGELTEYRQTIRLVRQIYGPTPARDFGPLALKVVRQRMIDAGWCRGVVNQRIGRVKRIFKWAVAEELVPPVVFQGLFPYPGNRLYFVNQLSFDVRRGALRLIFSILTAIVVIVAAVVFIGPLFISTEELRNQLFAQVESTTGYRLRVSGPLDITLFPSLNLVAEDVGKASEDGHQGCHRQEIGDRNPAHSTQRRPKRALK